jgi:GNAT superfamily N-acetyltransferase
MVNNQIEIKEVVNPEMLKKFIKLPWKIYKNDANWVPPLISEIKKKMDTRINPFFKHSNVSCFLAYRDDRIVGRVVSIVDYSHNSFHREKTGFFGMFECFEDYNCAHALLEAVRRRLRTNGMNLMRGPVNLSMNDECGFLIERFDSPPVFMMTYNPEYYLDFMERYGMTKAKDLYAYLNEGIIKTPERLDKIAEHARQQQNVHIRPLNMKRFKEEADKIKQIYNEARENNWGFVPMTAADMDFLAANLKRIAIPELILFAEINKRPVGISVTVPNYNEALIHMNGRMDPISIIKLLYYRKKIKGLRSLIMGVLNEYRLTGLPVLLFMETAKAAGRLGFEWCEKSWNLEDNHFNNKFDETIGGRLYKKYRIYEKPI